MGLLSANLLAKLQSGRARCAWLLELDVPSDTGTMYYSKGGWDSESAGAYYEDRIAAWGRLKRQISDPRSGSIPAAQTTVQLIDHDRQFANIVGGFYRRIIYGSQARIKLAEATLTSADWFSAFVGILTAWDPKDRVYTLSLRTDDRPLEAFHSAKLTQTDFPAADSKVWGQEAPRIYGKHASLGSTNGGMLPTLLVDVARFRYLACKGWAKAIDRVYVSGVEVTTGWTVDHPTVNGTTYTIITFATDQGTNPVTIDARGYETVGDGSGTLIENPYDQIAHALDNQVYGGSAPLDAATATTCAAYFTRKGLKGSGYIKDRFRGQDLVAGWLKTWDARAWWTCGGQLAFGIEDHVLAERYPSALYREDRHDIEGTFKQSKPEQLISAVAVHHMFSGTLGSYVQSLTVRDPVVSVEAEEPLDMVWSYASAA